jgi:hypothetical protein
VFEQVKTVHVLDRVASVTGHKALLGQLNICYKSRCYVMNLILKLLNICICFYLSFYAFTPSSVSLVYTQVDPSDCALHKVIPVNIRVYAVRFVEVFNV